MFQHFLNLFVRALVGFPDVLAGNWISLLLPLVVFIVKEGTSLRNGWASMRAQFWRDTSLLAKVYVALFAWAIVRTVYQDHVYFVQKTASLQKEARQDAVSARQRQEDLQNQFQALQVQCARTEGANQQLQGQNRDQQNSINGCLTQAIKLVTVPPFAFTTKVVRLGLKDASGKTVDGAIIIVSANRAIAAYATIQCSQDFEVVSFGFTGNPLLSMWDGRKRASKNMFPIARSSPGWDVSDEFASLVTYKSSPAVEFTCATQKGVK
jgi:hypothetical protein